MAGLIGFWTGGFVVLYLLSALVLLFFKDSKWSYKSVTIAALVALAIGTGIGGYGFADGGQPQFINTLMAYFVPFVGVLVVNLIRVNRKLAKMEKKLESAD